MESGPSLRLCYKNRSAPNLFSRSQEVHLPVSQLSRVPPLSLLYTTSRDMVGPTKTDHPNLELVRFGEGDPEDPVNWSARKKQAVVAILCILSFIS